MIDLRTSVMLPVTNVSSIQTKQATAREVDSGFAKVLRSEMMSSDGVPMPSATISEAAGENLSFFSDADLNLLLSDTPKLSVQRLGKGGKDETKISGNTPDGLKGEIDQNSNFNIGMPIHPIQNSVLASIVTAKEDPSPFPSTPEFASLVSDEPKLMVSGGRLNNSPQNSPSSDTTAHFQNELTQAKEIGNDDTKTTEPPESEEDNIHNSSVMKSSSAPSGPTGVNITTVSSTNGVSVSALSETSQITAPSLAVKLGDQYVDIGVSGQWIDGLSKEIAGLSKDGAQGRFDVVAGQLGAVQVDIRQGTQGASVSLVVATESAENILKEHAERLRNDAGFAAVRIADVKIERIPQATEATRSDHNGQQSHAQHQNGSAGQNSGGASAQYFSQGEGSTQPHNKQNSEDSTKASVTEAVIDKEVRPASVLNTDPVRYA